MKVTRETPIVYRPRRLSQTPFPKDDAEVRFRAYQQTDALETTRCAISSNGDAILMGLEQKARLLGEKPQAAGVVMR